MILLDGSLSIFTSCLYLGQCVGPILVAMRAGQQEDIPVGINNYALALLALAAIWATVVLHERRHTVLSH